jgi:site-specific DNA recombinase
MRCAVYARLSSDRSGMSDSTAIQEREARDYAAEQGWWIVGVFTDNDVSASRFSTKPRLGYEALFAAIQRGDVEVVLCTEMTRLYRRLEELLDLIRLAERSNLKRIETTDGSGYYLHTGEGVHAAVSSVNNAVLESRKISDRVKRKHRARAQAGLHNGGSRRYGYEIDAMTIRESEAAIIRECVERSINGEVTWRIVRDLNERGVSTAYGKQWRVENLQRLLLSKRIIGIREHNGATYPAQWPAIITPEDQEKTRLAWKARKQKPGRPRGSRTYLLTGIVFCGVCEAPMRGNGRPTERGYQRRYRCAHIDSTGKPIGCGRTYRGAEPLEDFVSEAVLYALDTPEVVAALADQDHAAEVERLSREIEFGRRKLNELVDDYASSLLTREQFGRAKDQVESKIEAFQSELNKLQPVSALPKQPIREAWNALGIDTKLAIIRLVINRVKVYPGQSGAMYKRWRFDISKVAIDWRVPTRQPPER